MQSPYFGSAGEGFGPYRGRVGGVVAEPPRLVTGNLRSASFTPFVASVVAPGARLITDGWSGHAGLPDHDHDPKVIGKRAAHVVLTWTHRVFANLKRWALGTFHGLRRPHLRRCLDEFVFRWNRRRHTAAAFDTLIGIAHASTPPHTAISSNNAPDPDNARRTPPHFRSRPAPASRKPIPDP